MTSSIFLKCIKINSDILQIKINDKYLNLIVNHINGLHNKLKYLIILGSIFFLIYYYIILFFSRNNLLEIILLKTKYISDIVRFYRKIILLHYYE